MSWVRTTQFSRDELREKSVTEFAEVLIDDHRSCTLFSDWLDKVVECLAEVFWWAGYFILSHVFPACSRHSSTSAAKVSIFDELWLEDLATDISGIVFLVGPYHQNISRADAFRNDVADFVEVRPELSKQEVIRFEM